MSNKNGISKMLSPGSIVLGRGKIDGNNLKATFGRYYEVYCGTDNTNKEHRTSAICLRPSNSQGGYYFMNIETGRKIHGFKFTELSMPEHVIDRVHALAEAEGAPDLDEDGCPNSEWELGAPVINEGDEEVIQHQATINLESDDESEDDQHDDVDDEDNDDDEDSNHNSDSDDDDEELVDIKDAALIDLR